MYLCPVNLELFASKGVFFFSMNREFVTVKQTNERKKERKKERKDESGTLQSRFFSFYFWQLSPTQTLSQKQVFNSYKSRSSNKKTFANPLV